MGPLPNGHKQWLFLVEVITDLRTGMILQVFSSLEALLGDDGLSNSSIRLYFLDGRTWALGRGGPLKSSKYQL